MWRVLFAALFLFTSPLAISNELSVSDSNHQTYTFKLGGKITPEDRETLKSDLESLGQTEIPSYIQIYQDAFGHQAKNYLEWFSERVRVIKIKHRLGDSIADYNKSGIPLIRSAQSIVIDPIVFDDQNYRIENSKRRSLLIHEAFHYDLGHHVHCQRPSHVTPGVKSCDQYWRGSYGVQFLYVASILESALCEGASQVLFSLATHMDRVVDPDSRKKLISEFQSQLSKLSLGSRQEYQSEYERSRAARDPFSKLPDISELFKQ